MHPTAFRSLVRRQARAWQTADIETLLADFHPQSDFATPFGRCHGTEQIRRKAEHFFSSALNTRIKILWSVFDGNRAAVEWTFTYQEKDTRRRLSFTDAILIDVKEGKIHSWREYFDPRGIETPT